MLNSVNDMQSKGTPVPESCFREEVQSTNHSLHIAEKQLVAKRNFSSTCFKININ